MQNEFSNCIIDSVKIKTKIHKLKNTAFGIFFLWKKANKKSPFFRVPIFAEYSSSITTK